MNNETISSLQTMSGGEKNLLAGRYRAVRQLGQGGMGSVWLAEDTELENRKVAIKMLPPILVSSQRALRQLKSEALVSLKLTHPNIATLRSFEENGGNPFLVMDFIDGRTLDDLLAERGTLGEDEVLALLYPVADALDYAHLEKVVHRDVKPSNVMVRADGTPFVLDFGIAREIQETMTRVTGHMSSGTLMYMSPEQLHGKPPTSAQDIYSFAAMAYECLAGTPPFHRGQVEFQILNDAPPPLPSDSAFAKGILRGLSKDPAARPSSCLAVLGEAAAVGGNEQAEKILEEKAALEESGQQKGKRRNDALPRVLKVRPMDVRDIPCVKSSTGGRDIDRKVLKVVFVLTLVVGFAFGGMQAMRVHRRTAVVRQAETARRDDGMEKLKRMMAVEPKTARETTPHPRHQPGAVREAGRSSQDWFVTFDHPDLQKVTIVSNSRYGVEVFRIDSQKLGNVTFSKTLSLIEKPPKLYWTVMLLPKATPGQAMNFSFHVRITFYDERGAQVDEALAGGKRSARNKSVMVPPGTTRATMTVTCPCKGTYDLAVPYFRSEPDERRLK